MYLVVSQLDDMSPEESQSFDTYSLASEYALKLIDEGYEFVTIIPPAEADE